MCLETMALVLVVAVAVLGLLSLGEAAPLSDCQRLTQQIDIQGRDQLLGKWYHQGEATNMTGSTLLTKAIISSVTVTLSAAEESNAFNVVQNHNMLGHCYTIRAKLVLENNGLTLITTYPATEVLLSTSCPDCLAIYTNFSLGSSATYRGIQLLSKRTRVSDAELEEFKQQVECLNLPPAAIMSPDKEFCPDVSNDADGAEFDLSSLSSNVSQTVLRVLERTINSEGGVQQLLDLISNSLLQPKQQ